MNCASCERTLEEGARFCPYCGTQQPSAVRDPLIGVTLLGKYRVRTLLGQGGMGAVYEAEQHLGTTTRLVAIKTLHPHLTAEPSLKARFERECGTLARLSHPNTVQVFDFGSVVLDDGERWFLVMEYVRGQTLLQVIASEAPLAPARVLGITRQVVEALAEAHAQGVIHRDLKPENIVLTERAGTIDYVKLLDFGVAKIVQEDASAEKLTQQGAVIGTIAYMSPEQLLAGEVDVRSDVYSLGLVVYEMLTGTLPFHADAPWAVGIKRLSERPLPLESQPSAGAIPEPMRRAVMKALARHPHDRFESVTAFSKALESRTSAPPPAVFRSGDTEIPLNPPQLSLPAPAPAHHAHSPHRNSGGALRAIVFLVMVLVGFGAIGAFAGYLRKVRQRPLLIEDAAAYEGDSSASEPEDASLVPPLATDDAHVHLQGPRDGSLARVDALFPHGDVHLPPLPDASVLREADSGPIRIIVDAGRPPRWRRLPRRWP